MTGPRLFQELRSAATGSSQPEWSIRPMSPPSPTDGQHSAYLSLRRGNETGTRLQQAGVAEELEEFFEGFVTEIGETEIRLSTVSSQGETGDAWLPRVNIPDDEMEFLELGVPVRVNVRVRSAPQRERAFSVRFLRPHQWYRATKEEAAQSVEYLVKRMREVLSEKVGVADARELGKELGERARGAA